MTVRVRNPTPTSCVTSLLIREHLAGEALGTTNADCDVGWWSPGTWLNYTRTFPTNTYVVYGRLAYSGPYSGADMSLVTAGRGASSKRPSH